MVCKFATQHFRRIDLYKDARPPVVHAILIKEPVRSPSVAKNARMTATSIWVDRPLKGHSLHAIQNRLHLDLDPLDLGQNARACGLEETRLQRGRDRVRLRKEFGGEPHGANTIYEHKFVSMPNAGVLDKGFWNAANLAWGAGLGSSGVTRAQP